jgi:hypothetical protein
MSDQTPEPPPDNTPDPQPEPLKFDPPNFDYIEKGHDPEGIETRDIRPDEGE